MNSNHARNWDYTSKVSSPIKEAKEKGTVKVRKQGWITKGEKLLYTIVGVCMILASAYIVSFSSSTDQLNRDLQNLDQQVVDQSADNQMLLYEIERLSEPARITKIAREKGFKVQNTEVKHARVFNNN